MIIVNRFNEPLGNEKEEERKTKRFLIKTLFRHPDMNGVIIAYDGDRLLFSIGNIPSIEELQQKSNFIRQSNRWSRCSWEGHVTDVFPGIPKDLKTRRMYRVFKMILQLNILWWRATIWRCTRWEFSSNFPWNFWIIYRSWFVPWRFSRV